LERIGRREAMSDQNTGYDAIFVGGGVIGLASAWRAAARGARVCVLERDRPAAGATGVAAGMLAPVGEALWGEEELLALNLDSLRRWPAFARELEDEAELEISFSPCGALHVALDRDEAEELRRRHEFHRDLGARGRPRSRGGRRGSEESGGGPARGTGWARRPRSLRSRCHPGRARIRQLAPGHGWSRELRR
jgi:glycine/D-amino acid oxidase-like deaminating enzyme